MRFLVTQTSTASEPSKQTVKLETLQDLKEWLEPMEEKTVIIDFKDHMKPNELKYWENRLVGLDGVIEIYDDYRE